MNQSAHTRNLVFKDVAWYSFGTIIPILISVLRTPVFTRYFTPEEYGTYGLVFISVSIISVFLYTWLSNSVWRFYFKFKRLKRLNQFYTNLLFIHAGSTIVFLLLIILWVSFYHNALLNRLVILICIQTFLSQLLGYLLIAFRLERKSALYNRIHSIRACASFGVQYVLTYQLGLRIEAIPLATIFIEFLLVLFLLKPVSKHISLRFSLISKRIVFFIGSYAIPGIVTNISVLLLTFSDRYIISLFGNMQEVGIYNQIYNFSQISIMALISIFFSVINPEMNHILENEPDKSKNALRKYFSFFIVLFLPLVVYTSLFAKPITEILFGESFRSGYTMIPFIAFSAFCNGMLSLHDNKFKFENRYRLVIKGFLLATGLNIVLNLMLIPLFGYKLAALTTLISYFTLYVYYYLHDDVKSFKDHTFRTLVIKAGMVLIIQLVLDLLMRKWLGFDLSIVHSIAEGLFFVMVYYFLIARPNIKTLSFVAEKN